MAEPDDRSKQRERLPYPPPFQDLRTLVLYVSLSKRTIEERVRLGQFPQQRHKFGKRLWVWKKVDGVLLAAPRRYRSHSSFSGNLWPNHETVCDSGSRYVF
jgi:hypothetical protein